MNEPIVVEHPVCAHHLAILRDKATGSAAFRDALERVTSMIVYEATRDLTLDRPAVRTPLAEAPGAALNQRVGLVPILRAGLGMVGPALAVLPDAEVWHLGLYRDEATLEPVEYYKKLPASQPVDVALVLDPMLATGGSATAALHSVQRWGVRRLKLLSVLAAPEGLRRVADAAPHAQVVVAAIDERLDERGFIVPGLGDAGDRTFNAVAE